jgi:predicted PurR-regulated permease PerM
MEITSFVLGMLAIVAVSMVTVIVVGIVKILKLNKQINNIWSHMNDIERHVHDRIDDEHRRMEQAIIDIHRDINMVEGTMKNQIDQARQESGKATHTARTDLSRYIDSRIDKLIDTYFEHVGAKTPPKKNKELING